MLWSLNLRPALVGTAVAGVQDELGAILGRVRRVVEAVLPAVGLQHELAVGEVSPDLVRGAVTGVQDGVAPLAAPALGVHALAQGGPRGGGNGGPATRSE